MAVSASAVVVNFAKYQLEVHVQRSLQKAWSQSRGGPLNASHLLKGALVVGQTDQSEAFGELASLLPLPNLQDVKATDIPSADLAALPVTKPLADSYAVAEGFFKDKGVVWGRDYVTLALLAKDDPSLAEIVGAANSNLQSIHDAWFQFVSADGDHRTPEEWQRWWRGAGVPLPAGWKQNPAAAYLFTWNPKQSRFADLDRHVTEIDKQGASVFPWGTGNRRSVSRGQRVFLLRQGVEPRGLIGVGEIHGEVREVPHFDPAKRPDATSLLVDVRWTALSREPFVALPRLEQETGDSKIWSSQSSGVELHPVLSERLEEIWPRAWAEHVRGRRATPDIEPKEWIARFDADRGGKDDTLNLERYVRAFSRVMASCTLIPPLSIGLFGDWGSGKSFFMDCLFDQIEKLKQEPVKGTPLYWQNICQIKFNAWHYTETNLWASLVGTIFNELRCFLDGPKDDADEFNQLLNNLELASELRKEAQEKVKEAVQRRKEASEKVAQAQKDLGQLHIPPQLSDEELRTILSKKIAEVVKGTDRETIVKLLESAADWSGRQDFREGAERLRSGSDTVEAVTELLDEAQALSLRAGFWWRVLSGAKVYKTPGFWIVVAALLAIPTIFFLASKLGLAQNWASLWTMLGESITLTGAIIAWIRSRLAGATAVFDRLSLLQANVARSIEEARGRDRRAYETRRDQALKNENEARANLEHLRGEEQLAAEDERKAREALRDSTSQARLGRFIRDRAGSADYEKHLGLIAMIRRDFERLSELMEKARKNEVDPALPRIDRIILYIDDLDRCYPPEKVVKILEAVHLLLFFPLFIVVVGVDSRWVSRSLHMYYEGMLADEAISAGPESPRTERAPAESQDFLEKIFQVPFWLRRMEPAAVRRLIHSLISSKELEVSSATSAVAVAADGTPTITGAQPVADSLSTDAHASTTAEDPSRAEAKRTTAEAEGSMPDDARMPVIESLTITEAELSYMDTVAPLMPRTPRSVKRFVNIYRLYKAALSPDGLATFLGSPAQPGNFRAVQVLLALVTGTPGLAQAVFHRLQESDVSASGRLSNLAEIGIVEETWQTTLDSLREFAQGDYDLPLEALREVSPLVARYSVHHMVSPEPGESGLG
jgi:hypothetical protein